jgi:hypothetical protein
MAPQHPTKVADSVADEPDIRLSRTIFLPKGEVEKAGKEYGKEQA